MSYSMPDLMYNQAEQLPPAFCRSAGSASPPLDPALFVFKTMSGAVVYAFMGKPGANSSNLDSLGYLSARDRAAEEIEELAAKWKALLLDTAAPKTANALTRTARPIFQALLQFGPGAIDLRGLSPAEINVDHLAVILRATLSHKHRTPGWTEALHVAREALRGDPQAQDDTLGGLI